MSVKLAKFAKNRGVASEQEQEQEDFAVFVSFAVFATNRDHECSVTVKIDG